MKADDFKSSPLVAIIRGIEPRDAAAAAKALYEGGVRFMEVTMNSPFPAESIAEMRAALKGLDARIGAGTVTTLERLEAAAKAGAEFIISPDSNPAIVKETKKLGLLSIPGFLTPTEAFLALEAGADVLKLFPCATFGPGYIKDLKAVIDAPIMAVGGVDERNMEAYLKVAEAVGLGSSLYKKGLDMKTLKERAKSFIRLLPSPRPRAA